jgi:myo-inositol-1(or 4)-monophosphatase
MINAAQKAGRSMVRDFGELEHLQVSRKSLGNFVSTADQRSEKILVEELKKARPDFGFLLEEGGAIPGKDSEATWIIDPLDGTTNFLHGIPHFAINIALQKKDEIVAGVTYNPITDELYWAEKGGGTFVNQRRLRVSGRRQLDESLIATGTPFGKHGNGEFFMGCFKKLVPLVSGVRRSGSMALDLAYLAAGRFDGILFMNMSVWDLAAGSLMIREAGGYLCDFEGQQNYLKSGHIIAGNEAIFAEFKSLLGAAAR